MFCVTVGDDGGETAGLADLLLEHPAIARAAVSATVAANRPVRVRRAGAGRPRVEIVLLETAAYLLLPMRRASSISDGRNRVQAPQTAAGYHPRSSQSHVHSSTPGPQVDNRH